MHPAQYSGAGNYPNPVQTGRPPHQGPRRKVWPPLVAFLLVSTVAVALVVAGYRFLREDAERQAAADAAAAALAPSADECALIRDLFDTWMADDPPLTLEATRGLTAQTAAVSVAAGQQFAAGMETIPEQKARDLRAALRDYNEALDALTAGLSTGPAADPQAHAVWTARTQMYERHGDFRHRYCQ